MMRSRLGFTLIELMITVAIVGILSAIAYPSYQQHVMKSRRGEAKACVLEMAQFMERFYTTNRTYAGAVLPAPQCTLDLQAFYAFALPAGTLTATTYTIDATPIGAQVNDVRCDVLSLDQAGRKTISGTSTVAECW